MRPSSPYTLDPAFYRWLEDNHFELVLGRYLDLVAKSPHEIDRFLRMLDITKTEALVQRPDEPRVYTIRYDEYALASSFALHPDYKGLPPPEAKYAAEYRAYGLELLVDHADLAVATFTFWHADKELARIYPDNMLPYSLKKTDENGLIVRWRPNSEAGIVFDEQGPDALIGFYADYVRAIREKN